LIRERRRNPKISYASSMTSATLTSPPTVTARLVFDTDVASLIFKWHPEFAPRYVAIVRGSALAVSFMTLAEMRQGALDANWGRANATCWKRIRQTLRSFIPTTCCAQRGLPFGTRARERDVQSARPTHGLQLPRWSFRVPLVTNNPKDYRHQDKLQLVSAVSE
jgi:hypothetical protein